MEGLPLASQSTSLGKYNDLTRPHSPQMVVWGIPPPTTLTTASFRLVRYFLLHSDKSHPGHPGVQVLLCIPGWVRGGHAGVFHHGGQRQLFRALDSEPQTAPIGQICSVVQWHQLLFPFFLVAAPLNMVQAPKRVPFFSRVTEHVSLGCRLIGALLP